MSCIVVSCLKQREQTTSASDLETAGLIGDPLYELNWLNSSIWNNYTWTYTKAVTLGQSELAVVAAGGTVLLVFDGIKMGAEVKMNGKLLTPKGQPGVADQFLRYEFPLTSAELNVAADGSNELSVAFVTAIDCHGRWMSCTGGWDWAPYTNTHQDGIPTMTKGIWKSVYMATVSTAAITHVNPQIKYKGVYPAAPLADGSHGGFAVTVKVHMWAAAATQGTLAVKGSWGSTSVDTEVEQAQAVAVPAGDSVAEVSLAAAAADIKLWWPAGQGAQPLYNVSVSFGKLEASRRIGFRTFALVTGNDTDPAYVTAAANGDGTDRLGMLFRINGAAIFSKGGK
eukprot:SAG11_NODE_972_length_6340_cov_3.043423_7_plen_340_part_00